MNRSPEQNLSPEQELDLLIDILNHEQRPPSELSPETARLSGIVRAVKRLKDQPESAYEPDWGKILPPAPSSSHRSWKVAFIAGLTACAIFLAAFFLGDNLLRPDVVYAMEKTVFQLSGYHGILEKREKNAAGDEWLIQRVQIWAADDKYALEDASGTLTVNNGTSKWQVSPTSREVSLLPFLPDQTPYLFNLYDEARQANQYPHRVVGQEMIAGRQADKVEISPPGGLPYHLWIDSETHLPLQLQTAMQNSLQMILTFVSFEANPALDQGIFTYQVPEGYTVVEENPGQWVTTASEASAISGFSPILPHDPPSRILAFSARIVLDYGDTTITQSPANSDAFAPSTPNGSMGRIGDIPVEILDDIARWQQNGLEIMIEGPGWADLVRQIAPDFTMPDLNADLVSPAEIKANLDMEIVKNNQQQVDGGHSPWQLDPLQVAMAYVEGELKPIYGDGIPPMSEYIVEVNNGVETVLRLDSGPIEKIYLQRLIRQDSSGIWTVVGYDPA